MRMQQRGLIVIIILVTGLYCSCAGRRAYVPVDKRNLQGEGEIAFVPLGEFPAATARELAAYYQTKYGLTIDVLPNLPLDAAAWDDQRQQLIAEDVIALMKNGRPDLARAPKQFLIGLTTEDMYIAQYTWQFTFSWRQEGKYAVVSNARMKLGSPSAEKLMSRLRKMVTKNIGVLYYRLPQSDDSRSVLYQSVGGLTELDYMGEEF